MKAFLPIGTKIIYYETKETVFRGGFGSVILADWSDVPDDFDLLIPVKNGKKVSQFRAPVVYFENEEILKRISKGIHE